jgi:monooxygenase
MTEHLDVLVVGAGLSGIGAGHYLQAECPWASYAIFEARGAIGGTWDLFRYPGVRSDSDMFTLGYAFRPWDDDKAIADGPAILDYIRATAADEGIDGHIRFHHRIVRADWSTADARWHVTAERGDTGETVKLTCGFIFSCTGYYRYDHGHQPQFAGMDDFAGTVVHPQAWPDDIDYAGKRIVVIGSGATAVTLIPSLARTAAHVTMLQRSPSYITALPAEDPLANLLRGWLPARVSGPLVRWYKALTTQAFFQLSRRRPQLVKRLLRRGVQRQLPAGYDVDTHFSPRYNPWDQRLCLAPDGDLFRAISAGTASVVTDTIDRFTEGGLRLSSGAELPADIVVTATGLELLFLGGMVLTVDGDVVELPEKFVYKGMMLEGVPNLALAVGYTNASWTLKCDLTCQYVTRLLNHLRAGGLRQAMAVNDDESLTGRPMLGLTSGYVLRSQHAFPKQGSRSPWQVHQSYLKDYRAMRLTGIEDEAMRFSNPVPAAAPSVAVGAP